MLKYLSKVLYILAGAKRNLVPLIFIFTISSVLETLGVGLVGPFLNLASYPESFHKIPLLDWVYRQLGMQSSSQFILMLGLIIIVLFCIKAFLYFLARIYTIQFGFHQKSLLISRLLHAYLVVPYTFYLKRNTASLIQNVISETEHFTHYCLLPLLNAVANFIVMFVLLLLLAKTSLLLLVMMLGILLPIFLLFQRFGGKLSKWGEILSKTHHEMIRIINHSLGGVKETRIIGCELYFEQQMAQQTQKHSRAATFYLGTETLPRILIETFLLVFLILFISLSQLYSKGGTQDLISILGVFAVASLRLIPSSSQFVQSIAQMRRFSHSLDMLYLDIKEVDQQSKKRPDLEFNPKAVSSFNFEKPEVPPMSFSDRVDLKNITYAYPGTSDPSLRDISLTLKKGQSIALIGKSGAGKTTLVDVILGLLEPDSGDISVDGASIYDNLRSWQNLVGYIPQSISLIDDTVERNIAFGVPDHLIDSDRLNKAIKAAQLNELIEQLPDGIKTSVGERGVRLSGGQRQRIGIARALYFEREILVLDEATSALDNETESLVTEAIRALSGTKTMIIIAHRLTTVEHCDRIYLLKGGRIVQSGSYQEVVVGDKVREQEG